MIISSVVGKEGKETISDGIYAQFLFSLQALMVVVMSVGCTPQVMVVIICLVGVMYVWDLVYL